MGHDFRRKGHVLPFSGWNLSLLVVIQSWPWGQGQLPRNGKATWLQETGNHQVRSGMLAIRWWGDIVRGDTDRDRDTERFLSVELAFYLIQLPSPASTRESPLPLSGPMSHFPGEKALLPKKTFHSDWCSPASPSDKIQQKEATCPGPHSQLVSEPRSNSDAAQ